jgi:hypothetical protein
MKFLSVLTLLLASPLVSAASFPSIFDPTQATLATQDDKKLDVPGQNPLKYCVDPAGQILTIKSVDLSPNPPAAYVTRPIFALP